jgi:hypothetical protein
MRVVFSGRRGWSDAAREAAAKGRTAAAQKRREAEEATRVRLRRSQQQMREAEEQRIAEEQDNRAFNEASDRYRQYRGLNPYVYDTLILKLAKRFAHEEFKAKQLAGLIDPRTSCRLTAMSAGWLLKDLCDRGLLGSYRLTRRRDAKANSWVFRVENVAPKREERLE